VISVPWLVGVAGRGGMEVHWSVLTSPLGLWTGPCGLFVAWFVGVDVDWSIRVVCCLVRWGLGIV
jgi:hypothetical protein